MCTAISKIDGGANGLQGCERSCESGNRAQKQGEGKAKKTARRGSHEAVLIRGPIIHHKPSWSGDRPAIAVVSLAMTSQGAVPSCADSIGKNTELASNSRHRSGA